MKLIFLNRYFHPDTSATSQLLTDLAFRLAADGLAVHVIASRQLYDRPSAALPKSEATQAVEIHRVWTTSFGRSNLIGRAFDYLTFYISAGAALWRLAAKGDVVIAKTDPPLISTVAAGIARCRQSALVNWLQDVFPEVAEQLGVAIFRGIGGSFARSLRNYSLRYAATNVALGVRMAGVITALAPGARVEVIHNWSDGTRVRPIARSANPLRSEWKLGERFVVGYSGNMGRAHEFDTILKACELLREEVSIGFVFVGAGKQRDWIERETARRSLANVIFQPHQPRDALANSLSVPDVHLISLLPELEGLIVPSKFYGVAAAGRASIFIGDRSGEIALLLEQHGCGINIGTGDARGLAAAIRRLAAEPAVAAQMGERARAAFETNFDFGVAYSRWKQVLLGCKPVT